MICKISNNSALAGEGGGIRGHLATITIESCTIEDNFATQHGGGMKFAYGNYSISSSFILHNNASYSGGGVYCDGDCKILYTSVSQQKYSSNK